MDPDYARTYTIARLLAWQEGYALTLHGSFTRDLDLVAVPWTDSACEPEKLVARIADACDLKQQAGNPGLKPHGRTAWTLLFKGFGDPRYIDLSIVPRRQDGNLSGIRRTLNDDGLAATCQTLGQYRTILLKELSGEKA